MVCHAVAVALRGRPRGRVQGLAGVQAQLVGEHLPGPSQRGQRIALAAGRRIAPGPAAASSPRAPGARAPGPLSSATTAAPPCAVSASSARRSCARERCSVRRTASGTTQGLKATSAYASPRHRASAASRWATAREGSAPASCSAACRSAAKASASRASAGSRSGAGRRGEQHCGCGPLRPVRLQRAAHVGEVRLQAAQRAGRRRALVEVRQQPVHRHRGALADEQPEQHGALARPPEVGERAVDLHLERALDADLQHSARVGAAPRPRRRFRAEDQAGTESPCSQACQAGSSRRT